MQQGLLNQIINYIEMPSLYKQIFTLIQQKLVKLFPAELTGEVSESFSSSFLSFDSLAF